MSSDFFDNNSYYIDEKVNFFKFENVYQIFNDLGQNIGSISQKLNIAEKILRLFVGKSNLPFYLEIRDSNDKLQSTISRGWTLFLSNTVINDAYGKKIGLIQQKFRLIKPAFEIFDAFNNFIAEIKGDWRAWEFIITDSEEHKIGTVSKKWAGAVKEIFSTADKYHVTIDPNYSNKTNKIAILSSAITIDMVLKEKE